MKISLLVPTRQRPDSFYEMCVSILKTVGDTSKIEVVAYLDNDDTSNYMFINNIKIIRGERIPLSAMWNECQKAATGDIFMHASDNIRFTSIGWDIRVRELFQDSDDKILFVHGDDGYWGAKFGALGFVHKNWIDAAGYFVPPYFSSKYDCVWLNDAANAIDRRVYIPNLTTEYINHRIGIEKFNNTHHGDSMLYKQKDSEREAYIKNLQEYIEKRCGNGVRSELETAEQPVPHVDQPSMVFI